MKKTTDKNNKTAGFKSEDSELEAYGFPKKSEMETKILNECQRHKNLAAQNGLKPIKFLFSNIISNEIEKFSTKKFSTREILGIPFEKINVKIFILANRRYETIILLCDDPTKKELKL